MTDPTDRTGIQEQGVAAYLRALDESRTSEQDGPHADGSDDGDDLYAADQAAAFRGLLDAMDDGTLADADGDEW
jgi:hypothetical protein